MGDMADLIEFWCPEEEDWGWTYEDGNALLRTQNKLLRAMLEFMDAEIRDLKKRLGEVEEEW